MTASIASPADRFLALHRPGEPLLLPNAWDVGSARLFASLGFSALATTSSGFAATRGLLDGQVDREGVLAHAAELVSATSLPVSADLENCFAEDAAGVAETIRQAAAVGLAGASIEDFTGDRDAPIYPLDVARDRVAAAAEVSRSAGSRLVLTARAENHLYGQGGLDDTIRRLQTFAEVGADVVYAPGLTDLSDIRRVVSEVGVPVNVLTRGGGPTVAELAGAGVARISVGGALAFVGLAAVAEAARELLEQGTVGFTERAQEGAAVAQAAFGDGS
ncbi:isocitrate lyase/PEP mutase family protein [Ornithinimicrobium faecis]|uniref:isocitrate lyase/PEP mutase family protein n=1 Tax=Ornithinimicrobium faecis TaxID=2934158 RepID=UPI0021185E1D|nr:isocitrate lyase/phosphoenolpyruvate mutase family protein [Ornithinimicrobium sp. HY1745]